MKIEINWDLMSKIKQAKYGFDLQRDFKVAFVSSILVTSVFSLFNLNDLDYQKKLLMRFGSTFVFGLMGICIGECASNKLSMGVAKKILSMIAYLLKDLNIDTNEELLMKSEKYLTKYKIKLDDYKIPYVLQEKYINIPILSNEKEDYVSVLEEHVIGSNKYIISRGELEKKKVLKPAFNQI